MQAFLAQLRTQARELAAHLQSRQEELDRREAELNARLAELEKQARAARLWMIERQHELAVEREQLDAHRAENEQASVALEQPAGLAERERAVAEQLAELGRREREFEAERKRLLAEVERQRADLEQELWRREAVWQSPSPEQLAERQRLKTLAERLLAREEQLVRAEALLAQGQQDVEVQRRRLADRQEELEEQAATQQRLLADERRRAEAEHARLRMQLGQRGDELDVRAAATEQLRNDLTRLHRETLEMRLATEELWAQLAGAMAPAALTQSLASIRTRLADYYRLSEQELAARQNELQKLNDQVTLGHKKLAEQKQRLEDWAARRNAEIEEQASRLSGRERELQRQQAALEKLRLDWHSERQSYQQEIRRLMRQTRRAEPAPA